MSNAQEILNLQTELAVLQAEESAEAFAQELMDSIDQAQQVLAESAKDAEGAVENLEKVQKAFDKVNEALGDTSKFVSESAEAVGAVAEGVGKFKDKASDVKDVLEKIDGAMEKVQELRELANATSTEQIRALGDIIRDITGWLGDLIDFIPGLGAFIEIWLLAIDSLASSAATLESIVIKRNREAREANLVEPYRIIQVGATARANRIQEITSRLEELGVDMSPPGQTAEGEAIPVNVRNSISMGLRDCGMTYDEFIRGSEEAGAARREVNRLNEEVAGARATVFAGTRDGIPQGDVDAAEGRLPGLKEDLGSAIDDYESKAAVIQPCVDGMFGYMERYADDGVRDKWEEWMHSQYDPSYWLGPTGIEQIRNDAGIAPELGIPDSMSRLGEDETPTNAKGLFGNRKVLYIGGGGILAMSMLFVLVILPSDSKSPPENVQTVTPPVVQQETPRVGQEQTPPATDDPVEADVTDEPADVETQSEPADEPLAPEPAVECESGWSCDEIGDNEGSSSRGGGSELGKDGSDIKMTRYDLGSHIFTVTFVGNGQAVAESEETKWFNPRFIVKTPDGNFTVNGSWGRGREFGGDVSLGDDFGDRVKDAVITAVWLSSDTLEVTVTDVGIESAASSMLLELSVRLLRPDGTDGATYGDDALWES